MHVTIRPDAQTKISLLGRMAEHDLDGEPSVSPEASPAKAEFLEGSLFQVRRPDGPMTVMRTMQTSACERNCRYCCFRAGRADTTRVTVTPDEMAACFDKMVRADVVRGLFLSSGVVGGGIKTMDPLLASAELIRKKYAYRGYLHLKIMPGAQDAQVEAALQVADRVSVNLEAVDERRLATLAPQKKLDAELLSVFRTVDRYRQMQPPWTKRPSLVTQFVVGPAGESDSELLHLSSRLYASAGLARAYYSRFNPVQNTPLEGEAPTSLLREHRLYQADWLLRFYGYAFDDLPFDDAGFLYQNSDPKQVWASRHLLEKPVEVNRAERSLLLRVPGIGLRGADAILRARRQGRLRELSDLRALGVTAKRAAPFVLIDGHRPPHQLRLWQNDVADGAQNG